MEPWAMLPAWIVEFDADRKALESLFDAPYSPTRRSRLAALLEAWQDRLDALTWGELPYSDRVDALLLDRLLVAERSRLSLEKRRYEEMEPLCPYVKDLIELLDERRLLHDLEPRVAAETLHRAQRGVAALAKRAGDGTPTSGGLSLRIARLLRDLKKGLEEWYGFPAGYDPVFTWWVEKPHEALAESLGTCADALEKSSCGSDGQGIAGDPVGRETLAADLDAALVPYTPEELIAVGEREAQWCRREMVKAAQEMGCGEDWRAALERIKEDHVPPGDQARLVRDLAREAVTFLEERDLLTIPERARDGWRLEMMSPERQKVNPFFLGGPCIMVSYPTAEMDHEAKLMSMRGNNRHFSRATVQHELIPGHYLQHYCQQRYRPYRHIFHTPFWTEGWALYWEMRLWELGFPRTPEERMGMLFWRMHRAARVVFSLRFHLGEMTAGDCVEMLVNEVGHERSTAEGEVRRSFGGDYPPLYQCAYYIGGLQFRALHRELVETGTMTERAFHDGILRENCMPVAVLRAILRKDEVERHHPPVWNFLEE